MRPVTFGVFMIGFVVRIVNGIENTILILIGEDEAKKRKTVP